MSQRNVFGWLLLVITIIAFLIWFMYKHTISFLLLNLKQRQFCLFCSLLKINFINFNFSFYAFWSLINEIEGFFLLNSVYWTQILIWFSIQGWFWCCYYRISTKICIWDFKQVLIYLIFLGADALSWFFLWMNAKFFGSILAYYWQHFIFIIIFFHYIWSGLFLFYHKWSFWCFYYFFIFLNFFLFKLQKIWF